MTFQHFAKIAIFAAPIALAACDRNTVTQQAENAPTVAVAPAAPQPQVQTPAPQQAVVPVAIPPGTELPVISIASVNLSRPDNSPEALVIHAAGLAASLGWTDPKLEEMPGDSGNVAIKSFQFVATSPQTPGESRSQPIEAEVRVNALPPSVRKVRIVSGTNEVSVPVVQ